MWSARNSIYVVRPSVVRLRAIPIYCSIAQWQSARDKILVRVQLEHFTKHATFVAHIIFVINRISVGDNVIPHLK